MKKSLLSAAFVLLGVASLTPAIAQITVPASNPDLFVTNIFNDYGFPNSYTIDYSPNCMASMPCSSTNKQLTAIVADDGATAKLYVNDQTNAMPSPSVILPFPGGCAPDVVIGNDFTNPGNYIAAVTLVNAGNVWVFYYSISGVGLGGTALTITGPVNAINVSSTGTAVPPAHIDIACESSTPFLGLPQADKYTVTWQDNGIWGYANTLNFPGAGTTVVVDPNPNLSNPDVAYVERAGGLRVAEFGYADLTGAPNKLFYKEWQVIPFAAPGAPILYDNTKLYLNPFPGMVSVLRIDGCDNRALNTPGGPNAYFCMVASAPAPGSSVWVYSDKTGPFAPFNMTAPVTAPGPGITNATNEIPCVTSGPGRFFSVGFFSNPASSSGGAQQMYYATAINWATGKASTNPNAYAIMQQSYDPMYNPGLCLSATCNQNNIGVQDLFAGFDNYAFLLYKYSLPIAPYAFKNASVAEAASNAWQLSPVPATNTLTLTAPTGFNTNKGAAYEIADMSGKTVLSSTINETAKQISISNLPAGSYMLNVLGDKEVKTIKFVKE